MKEHLLLLPSLLEYVPCSYQTTNKTITSCYVASLLLMPGLENFSWHGWLSCPLVRKNAKGLKRDKVLGKNTKLASKMFWESRTRKMFNDHRFCWCPFFGKTEKAERETLAKFFCERCNVIIVSCTVSIWHYKPAREENAGF